MLGGTFAAEGRHAQGAPSPDRSWVARAWRGDGSLYAVARGCSHAEAVAQASWWIERGEVVRSSADDGEGWRDAD